MLGTKIQKEYMLDENGKFTADFFVDDKQYAACAVWCNENRATIEDKGDYFEVVAIPAPPLDEIKTLKWNEIKSARDKAEQAGCPYMGSVLDSDSLSVQRINTAVQAAQVVGESFAVDWTMQDNTVIHMTYADVLGMPAALAVFSNDLHQKARGLREQINEAETVEEVEAITWQ